MLPSLKVLLIAALALSFVPFAAQADEPPPLRIAVVDIQAALLKIPAGRRAKQQLEALAAAKQKDIEERKAALQSLMEEYQRQERLLQPQARREKLEEIQRLQLELQKLAFQYERELKEKEAELLKPISERLEKTIQTLAQAQGYTLVLHAAGVAFHVDAYDITEEVIKAYGQ